MSRSLVFKAPRRARVALAAAAWLALSAAAFGQIVWRTSLNPALKEASQTRRLALVFFYADGCARCASLQAKGFAEPGVRQLASEMVPVRLEQNRGGRPAAEKYGVTAHPTLLFLAGAGQVIRRVVGYLAPVELAREMRLAKADFAAWPKNLATLKTKPYDPAALSGMIRIHAAAGNERLARSLLARLTSKRSSASKTQIARAYSAIGDMYQMDANYEAAIKLFNRAAAAATLDSDRAYALISAASSHISAGAGGMAIAPLRKAMSLPGATREQRQEAADLLKEIAKSPG